MAKKKAITLGNASSKKEAERIAAIAKGYGYAPVIVPIPKDLQKLITYPNGRHPLYAVRAPSLGAKTDAAIRQQHRASKIAGA